MKCECKELTEKLQLDNLTLCCPDCYKGVAQNFEVEQGPRKPGAVLSNSTGWLARLDGCLKEVTAILAMAEEDKDNPLLACNLEDAETYLQIARGYMAD